MRQTGFFPVRIYRRFLDRWLERRTRLDLPLTLAYRQIFILPTRFGWMLGLLMFAMLIGSLNFNNNLGLLTTFMVGAIAVNSMLLAFRNLNQLELRHGSARPVHAGQPVRWQLQIINNGTRERNGLVLAGPGRGIPGQVAAGSQDELILELPARRRGWHSTGRIRLETTQPLGLFRAWSWLHPSAPFLVWPAPASQAPPLPQQGHAQSGQQQNRLAPGDEFHGLRRWREGDALHHIAWKASQRHQTLLSRELRQEQADDVLIDLGRTPGRDLEERIAVATAWILRAHALNRPWVLNLGGRTLGPARDEAHLADCMKALAEL